MGRIADLDLLGLRNESLEESLADRPVDEDPRACGALLPAVSERRAHDAERRLLHIRTPGDDGRVLSAHLRDDRLRTVLRERPELLEAYCSQSAKHEPVSLRIVHEYMATRTYGT